MPGFEFSEAAIDAYKAISLHIRQIFAEYTPIIEPLSLDEAYLDVTENLKGINSVIQICDGTGCLDQFLRRAACRRFDRSRTSPRRRRGRRQMLEAKPAFAPRAFRKLVAELHRSKGNGSPRVYR